jgi:hypothetical protein
MLCSPLDCGLFFSFIQFAEPRVDGIQSRDYLIEALLQAVKKRYNEEQNCQEDDGICHILSWVCLLPKILRGEHSAHR